MEKMQVIVPEGMAKKEWFTPAEFAAGIKTSKGALMEWIRVRPDFKIKFCQMVGGGSKRPRYLISWKGLAEYISQRESFRGNQHKEKTLVSRDFKSAKSNVAENANQNMERIKSQPPVDLDKLLAMSQNLLLAFTGATQKIQQIELERSEDRKQITAIVEKIDQQEKEMKKPLPIGSIHRQFLNDRVRMYAINQQIEFPRVWRKVNEFVGRGSVSFYEFADFQRALKFVKNLYEEAGMDWE